MKTELRVGQVWEDCDPRSAGRRIVIVGFVAKGGKQYAVIEPCTRRDGRLRRTKVREDRFRPGSTGYKLVSGGNGGNP